MDVGNIEAVPVAACERIEGDVAAQRRMLKRSGIITTIPPLRKEEISLAQ